MRSEVIRRNVSACLPENRLAGSRVELTMIRNNQGLLFACRTDAAQFDVTASLCQNKETKMLQR
jgi:hypothetical protein